MSLLNLEVEVNQPALDRWLAQANLPLLPVVAGVELVEWAEGDE